MTTTTTATRTESLKLLEGHRVVSRMTKRSGVVLETTALKARVRWSDGRVSIWMRADLVAR